MKKRIYIFLIVVLLLLVLLKVFIFIKNINIFKNYNDFVVEEDTIVKYYGSGNVVIPEVINGIVIKKIGNNAFNGLEIDNVVIPETIVSIGDYAFSNNNLKYLKIPESVLEIGEGSFMNNSLSKIEMSSNISLSSACFNNNLLDLEEAFFYKDEYKKELISYGGKIKGNVVLEEGVEIIGERAFLDTGIVSINISNSVYEIKKEAFKGNNLVEIFIPNSVSLIASDCFLDNNYLVDLHIEKNENTILNYPWGLNNSNINWIKK